MDKDECKSLVDVNHPTQGKVVWSINSLVQKSRRLIYLQRKHAHPPEMSGCPPAHSGQTIDVAKRHKGWLSQHSRYMRLGACLPGPAPSEALKVGLADPPNPLPRAGGKQALALASAVSSQATPVTVRHSFQVVSLQSPSCTFQL